MKSNIFNFLLLLAIVCSITLMSFRASKPKAVQYMHVNVLESVISGGVGRSRIIITDANGSTREMLSIKNYYSLTGVNFKNIKKNDGSLMILLNKLATEGWQVLSTTSSTAEGDDNGIFVTKYLLKKE